MGALVSEQTELFAACKHFRFEKPDISVGFEKIDCETVACTVRSNTFAKDVYLDFEGFDVIFSQNFFDIPDTSARTVTFKSDKTVQELEKAIRIKTVYDIGRG